MEKYLIQSSTQRELVAAQMAVRRTALDVPSSHTMPERVELTNQYREALRIAKQTNDPVEIAATEGILKKLEMFTADKA